jgi:hypothetical protein
MNVNIFRQALAVGILIIAHVSVFADKQDPYLYVLGVTQDAGYPQTGCYETHCMPGWNEPSLRRGAVSLALIDATFYADGELPGRDMSKIPHPFVVESMQVLAALPATETNKVWFIHMNHTNPLLDAQSKESKLVQSSGFNIAAEGIRLDL